MADPLHMGDIPEPMLRAWADQRVISSARYVEEMERRQRFSRKRDVVAAVPPLDYELSDDELSIELAFDEFELALADDRLQPFEGPMFSTVERIWLATGVIAGLVFLGIALS